MLFPTSALYLFALANFSAAFPFINARSGGTGSVAVVANHHDQPNTGLALRKAHLKHGVPLLAGLKDEAMLKRTGGHPESKSKRQTTTGTVQGTSLKAGYDLAYVVPANIGGQTLNLEVDTGSQDLWVFSNQQPAAQTQGHNVYNSASSKTFASLPGNTFNLTYGSGQNCYGNVGTDTVTIGGVSVAKQAVEMAQNATSTFLTYTTRDGVIGFGFSIGNRVTPTRQKTWIENALPSLQSPLFTVNIKHNAAGSFDFGYINASRYTGSISYTAASKTYAEWQVPVPSYAVGTTQYTTTSGQQAFIDTGSTLIAVSAAIASNYYAQVSGSQNPSGTNWMFPCTATLPDFYVSVGTAGSLKVPGSTLIYQNYGNGMCSGAIQPLGSAQFMILGTPFLKSFFVVFDYQNAASYNLRLGFASKPY